MIQRRSRVLSLILLTGLLVACLVDDARAVRKVDFETFSSGEVIAGLEPDGAIDPGTSVLGVTLSAINNSGGPHSLLVFDSSAPTGDDFDIGTPNESCGGPGVGTGGEVGQPGENCEALGNILIIAENLVDANNDGLVDDPDDERMGGVVTVDFRFRILFVSCTIIDIDEDEPGGKVELWDGPTLVSSKPLATLGHNNSAQTITFNQMGTRAVVHFPSSGAVGEFLFDGSMPVEGKTWGAIKSLYRD